MEPAIDPPRRLPYPPPFLSFGPVTVCFVQLLPAEPERGLVPAFHFRILTPAGVDVGFINIRMGDTRHVRLYAGHIGYEIVESFRGHRYAFQACRALAPFIRSVYPAVIITCDPDNIASIRTIERLGAAFLEEIDVPPDDPQYERGSRRKRRYEWTIH